MLCGSCAFNDIIHASLEADSVLSVYRKRPKRETSHIPRVARTEVKVGGSGSSGLRLMIIYSSSLDLIESGSVGMNVE